MAELTTSHPPHSCCFPGREHQARINQQTLHYYENLPETKRQEILQWLTENLASLGIPAKIKKAAVKELLAGHYHYPPTLLLIRQAMKKLNPEGLF